MKQCQAVTVASTYSAAHRCLKSSVGPKKSGRSLCTHHKSVRAPARPLPGLLIRVRALGARREEPAAAGSPIA